jgi:hypothetical protein
MPWEELGKSKVSIDQSNPGISNAVALTGSNVPINQLIYPVGELQKLNIPTYDGSNQPVHPSVVWIPNKLSGYKYWMAFTPYPDFDSSKENPSIVASNDGVNWEVPQGVTNPLVPAPDTGYYADPALLWDGTKLYLYWMHSIGSHYRITSTNGITWTEKETVTGIFGLKKGMYLCDGKFYGLSDSNQWGDVLAKFVSDDGVAFGRARSSWLNLHNVVVRHGSVYYDGGGFHYLINADPTGRVLGANLHYGYSQDGHKVFFDPQPVLLPDLNTDWISKSLYTSCIVPGDNGNYLLFVSAFSQDNKASIGMIPVKLNIANINFSNFKRGFSRTLWEALEIRNTTKVFTPLPLPEFNEHQEKVLCVFNTHNQDIKVIIEGNPGTGALGAYAAYMDSAGELVAQEYVIPKTAPGSYYAFITKNELPVLGILTPGYSRVSVVATGTAPTSGQLYMSLIGY